MSKYTPGPWCAQGISVHRDGAREGYIGRKLADCTDYAGIPHAEAVANAHLIAAAPALLHSEVEEYGHYLSGNVVAYAVLAPPAAKCDKCGHQPAAEQVISCGGFFNTDEAIAEARRMVDARLKK